MKHTPITNGLRALALMIIIGGFSYSTMNGYTFASLTQVTTPLTFENTAVSTDAQLAAANHSLVTVYDKADAAVQITLGMMLVILGLFVLLLARMRDEHNVHITAVPPVKPPSWFWMELKI